MKGFGKYRIPNPYALFRRRIANPTERVGFKVILSDNADKCRTDLRIHPDGEEHVGTAGCIGLTENKEKLNDFKGKIESYTKDGSTLNVNVSINNKPNYSDCDKNGNKKTKGGAAGN